MRGVRASRNQCNRLASDKMVEEFAAMRQTPEARPTCSPFGPFDAFPKFMTSSVSL